MKKRNAYKLSLNKKAISSLEYSKITGGETQRTDCTMCCWIDKTFPCDSYMSC
jgi:hypothetical protein